eukprot:6394892-Ditylum_brightwellii.AAC.1
MKSKAKKSNFYSYFIATDCVTTLDGKPTGKKHHYPDVSHAPSKFVKRNFLVEEYYDDMPATDIVNKHAQFLLGIEEAIHTKYIFKRIPYSIIGQWAANSFGMARAYSPRYNNEEHRKWSGFSSFV